MRATLTKDARKHLPIMRVLGDGTNVPAVALDRAVCVVGRGRWANLPLNQPQVSKVHALIVRGKGRVYLRDLASTNGVKRNGEPVLESELTNEDVIRIGGYTLGCESGFTGTPAAPTADAPPAQLHSGEAKFPLPAGRHTFLIGARKACDVRLEHSSVAPVHGVIFEIDGKHYLQDFGSTGGTRLNGRQIHREELNIGDEISIGDVKLTYEPAEAMAEDIEDFAMEEVALADATPAAAQGMNGEASNGEAMAEPLEVSEVADLEPLDAEPLDEQPLDAQPVEAEPVAAEPIEAEAPAPASAEFVEMELEPAELPEEVDLDPVEGFTRNPNATLDEIMASELPMADEEVLLEPMAGVDRDASTVEEISESDRPREDIAVAPADALEAMELEPLARNDRDNATLEEIDVADLEVEEHQPLAERERAEHRPQRPPAPATISNRDDATMEEIELADAPAPSIEPAGAVAESEPPAEPAPVGLHSATMDEIPVADMPVADEVEAAPQPITVDDDEREDEIPVQPLASADHDEAPMDEIPVAEMPREEAIAPAPKPVAEKPKPRAEVIAPAPAPIAEKPAPKPVPAPKQSRQETRVEPDPVHAEAIRFDEPPAEDGIDLAVMESVDWDAEVPPEMEAVKIEEPPEDSSILEFITTLVDEVNEKSATLKSAWSEYHSQQGQGGAKRGRSE